MRKYIYACVLFLLTVSCSGFLEEYSQDLSKVEGFTDLDELLIGDGYWRPGKACKIGKMLGIMLIV